MSERRGRAAHVASMRCATALCAAIAFVLCGCAAIPTSGPVEQVSPNAQQQRDTGVRIDAEGPRDGASQEIIVAGFINAMASLAPGFDVARDYLTDSARTSWDPGAGVTVYNADDQRLTETTGSEVLTASLTGRIDRVGRFVTASGTVRQDFGLKRVGGQWRISSPPAGLLVSSTTFQTYYTSMRVYFVAQDGASMVPETRRVPMGHWTPTSAITALLDGPSAWLADGVDTAFPPGTQLPISAVTVSSDGTAEVNLGSDIAALPDRQRQRLALQVAWTLQQFSTVNRVRLLSGGQALTVPGVAPDGVIDLGGYLPMAPVSSPVSNLVAVQHGRLGEFGGDGTQFEPTVGALASSGVAHATSFAASDAGGRLVWVDGKALRGATASGTVTLATGSAWGTPQFSPTGEVWDTTVVNGQRVLVGIPRTGRTTTISLGSVPAGTIRAFRVSPDGTRLAVVVQRGATGVLGVVALSARATRAGVWYPLSNASAGQLVDVRDVGWTGASDLAVLASTRVGGPAGGFEVSDDGATVTPLGPVESLNAQRLITQPRPDGLELYALTGSGLLLRCDDAWRWSVLAHDVTGATLSG